EATGTVDLRDHAELARLGIDPADAAAKWQADASAGRTPPSWGVRSALEDQGARGLIDPSRRRPGLWHLTLFAWNRPGAPTVRPLPEQSTRSEEHTSELQSRFDLVCRLLLERKSKHCPTTTD